MPGVTPVLGLPYPLETDPITVADFYNLANAIDLAQAVIETSAAAQITGRPMAAVRGGSNSSNQSVGFTFNWTTSASGFVTTDSMYSTLSPTKFTVNTAGLYLIAFTGLTLTSGYATVDQLEGNIQVNGQTITWDRTPGISSSPGTAGGSMLWPCQVGDQITLFAQWQGTGGPAFWGFSAFMTASYVGQIT